MKVMTGVLPGIRQTSISFGLGLDPLAESITISAESTAVSTR